MCPPDRGGGDSTAPSDSPPESDSHEALMLATYRALCDHGYADLTMADIAAEADRSTSLLHYHYDTKEGLLVAFLDYLFDEFGDALDADDVGDPAERLERLLAHLLGGPHPDEGPFDGDPALDDGFHTAMLELRAQAPYVPAYREAIAAHDDYLHALLVEILDDGMDTGVFHERNPDVVAATLLAAVRGDRIRSVVLGDDSTTEAVRQGIEEFVLADLLVDDAHLAGDDAHAGSGSDDTHAGSSSDDTAAPGSDG